MNITRQQVETKMSERKVNWGKAIHLLLLELEWKEITKGWEVEK